MDPLSHTLSGVIRVGVNVADPLSRTPSGAALAPTKITTTDLVHGQIFAQVGKLAISRS
jgi:hypothetical protein